MTQNRIVVFSNGIADFQRSFPVRKDEPTRISLPVRTDHIADVLASLNIYGPVTVTEPPSFRPVNESESNLSIDAHGALEDLVAKLSGAKVAVDKPGGTVEGTLVGLHTEPEGKLDERIFPKSVVILTDQGLTKIALKELQKLRFEDEAVRNEIAKALERSRQHIRPRSTEITLAVSTHDDDAEAIVQFTVPAAAWKISYRLRQSDGSFEFQGFAVVDNNTDEAWTDCLISVVTGEPITFSTDLADSKIPFRSHVNVVRESALGAVEVEEAVVMAAAAAPAEMLAGGPGAPRGKMRKAPASARVAARQMVGPTAATPDADVREIGDFCVFESQSPVTIDANRSAAIPVFSTRVKTASTVLHYKAENHPERPYRAIEFKNETTYSLGRGVCTVYEDGTYAGSCVIPAVKPGGECLLPHALETGVRVVQEIKRQRSKVVGLRLSEGFAYTSTLQSQDVFYRIRNSKSEPFTLLLDHSFCLSEPDVKCSIERADGRQALEPKDLLKNGVRLSLELAPEGEFVLTVSESRIQQSSVALADVSPQHEHLKTRWLEENLVLTNGPLAREPGIAKCLEIQQKLDRKRQEISDAVNETERLAVRQDRLRKNIGAGGHDEQTAEWKVELGEAEKRIQTLEDNMIPKLRGEERAITDELRDALRSLSAEWTAS